MKAEDILVLASQHARKTISFSDGGEGWLNEALTSLGTTAKTFYSLPSDALRVVEALDSNNSPYEDYDVSGSEIRFADDDTYSIRYSRLPAQLLAQTDTPEVHQAFHPVLALFVASRYKSKDDDENRDAQRLMAEFNAQVTRISATLRRQARRPGTVTVTREANTNA